MSFIPHNEVTQPSTHCPDEEAEAREVKSFAQGYIAKSRFKHRESGCKGFRVQGLTTLVHPHLVIQDQEAALWGHNEQ